jgi:hypothetical protein
MATPEWDSEALYRKYHRDVYHRLLKETRGDHHEAKEAADGRPGGGGRARRSG